MAPLAWTLSAAMVAVTSGHPSRALAAIAPASPSCANACLGSCRHAQANATASFCHTASYDAAYTEVVTGVETTCGVSSSAIADVWTSLNLTFAQLLADPASVVSVAVGANASADYCHTECVAGGNVSSCTTHCYPRLPCLEPCLATCSAEPAPDAALKFSAIAKAHKSYTLVYAMVGMDVGFENPLFATIELSYEEVSAFSHVASDVPPTPLEWAWPRPPHREPQEF